MRSQKKLTWTTPSVLAWLLLGADDLASLQHAERKLMHDALVTSEQHHQVFLQLVQAHLCNLRTVSQTLCQVMSRHSVHPWGSLQALQLTPLQCQ